MIPNNVYIEKWLTGHMSGPAKNTMLKIPGPAFDLPSGNGKTAVQHFEQASLEMMIYE